MTATESIRAADSAAPEPLPGDPLHVLVEHVREHPRIDAAAFVVVDAERGTVEPAAQWFGSPVVERAVTPHLTRPFDPGSPGLVEAVLDRAQPLFLMRVDSWQAADLLRAQVERDAGEELADEVWDTFGRASMIACPVRTSLGRTLGVLAVASLDPARPLGRSDLATVAALADLVAIARERTEHNTAEVRQKRREVLLTRAAEDAAASLEIADVERQVVAHALELVGADRAILTRGRDRGVRAAAGSAVECEPAAGALAAVVRSRIPEVGRGALHVPVALGPRLFGVLSVFRVGGAAFTDEDADVLGRLARSCAAALANAVDFERERRIARALTRGFVPELLPELAEWELGLLSEPAARQPAGGDVYGVWEATGRGLWLLIGDVAGKGVETAALSAMARFFIEARSADSPSPGDTLRQANALLRDRLPPDTFVTAFLGLLEPSGLVYANAGHLPPLVLRAAGGVGEAAGSGLPLGVDADAEYEDHALSLTPGDAVLAFTDGLVEARRNGELFGEQRVREAAAGAASRGMQDVVAAVHLAASRFSGGLQDDAVLLALRHR